MEVPVDEGGQPCQGGSGNCIVIQGNDMVFADHATFDFITMPGRYSLGLGGYLQQQNRRDCGTASTGRRAASQRFLERFMVWTLT